MLRKFELYCLNLSLILAVDMSSKKASSGYSGGYSSGKSTGSAGTGSTESNNISTSSSYSSNFEGEKQIKGPFSVSGSVQQNEENKSAKVEVNASFRF